MILNEKVQEYITSQPFKALAKKSRQTYKIALDFLVACYGGEALLEEMVVDLEKFIKFCEKRNMSGHSVQFRLLCAKIFLTWALGYEVKYTYRIPRDQVKARKLKTMKRWFSDEEIQKCLDYKFLWQQDDAPIYRIMVRMFIETGMRFSELMSIKWGHVKLDERMLLITDSKSEPRPAFFSPDTAERLAQWKKNRTVAPDNDEPVFPCANKAAEAIRQMLFDVGIKDEGDRRAAHTFRHYTATRLFYDGNMRIEDVAFLLGDEPNTIIQNYLHPTPKMLKKRVDEAMGWGKTKPDNSGFPEFPTNWKEAKEALMSLGHSGREAESMIARITYTPEMTAEEIVQNALRSS